MDGIWLLVSAGFVLGVIVGGAVRSMWQRYARGRAIGSDRADPEETETKEDIAADEREPKKNETQEMALTLPASPAGSAKDRTGVASGAVSLPVHLRDPLRLLRQTFRYDDIGAAFAGNERPYTFRMVSDFMEPEIPRHAQVLATPTDQFRDDAVYAFRLGDTFYIARIMRLPDWRLRVLPANEAYRPFTLSLRTADIAVLGRVFAVAI